MIFRPARATDFAHVETFVWQAIFPYFDRDDLTAEQRAENDALVETARTQVQSALEDGNTGVFVALEDRSKALAGYIIADASPRAYAEIPLIVVHRKHHGKGVAQKLLAEAINYIGEDRAVSIAVRHYNARAIAFFAKQGFVDTGETTGDHAIARTLMLREAHEPINVASESDKKDDSWANFPTGADEPVPVYEALPDYTLKKDDTPLFETGANALSTSLDYADDGETTLSDKQLTELEAFIARAKAKKGLLPETTSEIPKTTSEPSPLSFGEGSGDRRWQPRRERAYDPASIPFEVDYGNQERDFPHEPLSSDNYSSSARVTASVAESSTATKSAKPSFEFAFTDAAATAEAPVANPKPESVTKEVKPEPVPKEKAQPSTPKTKTCPDCATELPAQARFCYSCGFPQQMGAPKISPQQPTAAAQETMGEPTDVLELADLETLPLTDLTSDLALDEHDSSSNMSSIKTSEKGEQSSELPAVQEPDEFANLTKSDLKNRFRIHLNDRIKAYFGDRKLSRFQKLLETDTAFQSMRDSVLSNLLGWLTSTQESTATKERRLNNTLADLTEYFIVESASDLHKGVLPQKLLRHQAVNWETVDLFQLVMDYLEFDKETEVIYTDFVVMPARALRNATKSFLSAGKDERVFFICDQSLVSQAKNGFAITDSGIYWKNVLQPAGAMMYNELKSVRIHDGHLDLDGLFFNAGGTLNLKLALLLDKLRRMG